MKICNVETREHINNLSCIFDKFADKLSLAEKEHSCNSEITSIE